MKYALISVADKQGITEFATALVKLGYQIISTGGTAQELKTAGVEVLAVSEITGFPEILGGRVKTLHPKIHGGILARDEEKDQKEIASWGIFNLDLVVVNLYPFKEIIAREKVTLEQVIENIDIGGPAMLRAAAKNFQRVAVVVKPAAYEKVLKELKEKGEVSLSLREELAVEAFSHTASYDLTISQYLSKFLLQTDFPAHYFREGKKVQDLRYGENPHQKAALYCYPGKQVGMLTSARKLQGKELSYNNLVDSEAAWALVSEFSEPAAAIIKHTNPCGAALGKNILEAYQRAYASDPLSAFGGIVALNREVDEKLAAELKKIFLEIIIAPSFSGDAVSLLAAKQNLRLLAMGERVVRDERYWLEPISGGFLLQERDQAILTPADLKVVTKKQPSEEQKAELLFAWGLVKHVKSNAIVLTKEKQLIGVGAGQMNRVGAVKIALEQAADLVKDSVLASDAFFPFPDSVEVAAKAGVKAIIQPGGSVRDESVIEKADEYDIVLIFTGKRHFKH